MDDTLKEYRQHLVETLQKVSESYDKTVITLSGGALAVSFTFIKDFVGTNQAENPELLFWSWVLLSISLGSVLLSLFFGTLAFRKAIRQVDDGTIYNSKPGGGFGRMTIILHSSGALFLIVGILLLGSFVYTNLGVNNNAKKTNATHSTATTKTTTNRAKQGKGENPSRSTTTASSPTKP